MAKKEHQMMVRLDDIAHEAMQALARDTNITPAALARAAVLTMLAYYRRHNRIEFPIRYWEPAARAEEGLFRAEANHEGRAELQVAEGKAAYGELSSIVAAESKEVAAREKPLQGGAAKAVARGKKPRR